MMDNMLPIVGMVAVAIVVGTICGSVWLPDSKAIRWFKRNQPGASRYL